MKVKEGSARIDKLFDCEKQIIPSNHSPFPSFTS